MRLRITHEIVFAFDPPAKWALETVRLTPRGHDGQYVANWRIEVDRDCRLDQATDAFGNVVHSFTVDGPLDALTITALGDVETEDMSGIVRGGVERFPPVVFLRDTPLTEPGPAVRRLAAQVAEQADREPIPRLHALMNALADAMAADEVAAPAGDAETAFARGHGTPDEVAHAFIAASRLLGLPARFVSGYRWREDSAAAAGPHGWAEAYAAGIGWVGFDASARMCPTDRYVRVATGLDGLGAAPVRGHAYGAEPVGAPTVSVRVGEATTTRR